MRRRERERDIPIHVDEGPGRRSLIGDVQVYGKSDNAAEPAGRMVLIVVDDTEETGLVILSMAEDDLRDALGPAPTSRANDGP